MSQSLINLQRAINKSFQAAVYDNRTDLVQHAAEIKEAIKNPTVHRDYFVFCKIIHIQNMAVAATLVKRVEAGLTGEPLIEAINSYVSMLLAVEAYAWSIQEFQDFVDECNEPSSVKSF